MHSSGPEVLLYAVPAFALLLTLEILYVKRRPGEEFVGFGRLDTRTSLAMGTGSLFTSGAWKVVALAAYSGLYELAPWHLRGDVWWTWVILLFAEDLCYYAYHRTSHEVRVFWASHVVHHSSQHYNLSTALRQTWVPVTTFPFWLALPLLGFPPWMILVQQSISLIYQYWIHTERIATMWRPFELVMNTPSHHRVHHGANPIYLDRNYAGIFIIWDRMFGSFQGETEPVRYGLTKNISTHNPLRVAFHEYAALAHDVRHAPTWRARLGYLLRSPGWTPV